MAKTKTRATLSPSTFRLGETIFAEDIRIVPEAQAYAAGEVVEGYSASCGIDTSELPKVTEFRDAEVVKAGSVLIPPHAQSVYIETSTSGSGTGSIDVEIGGQVTSLATGVQEIATVATSLTGTGLVDWSVTTNLTSGSLQLTRLTIRTQAIAAADLEDPVDE